MRKVRLGFLTILLVLILISFATSEVFAKAKITFLTGTVKFQKSGSEDWQDAKIGTELDDKDSLKTGKFSNVELEFPKENKIKIAQNTVLKIEEVGKESKSSFKVESGKVFMQIKKGDDTKVKTPNAVAGVRGTRFFVVVEDGETYVYTVEGSVWVKKIGFDEEKIVNAGQILDVLNSGFGQLRNASNSDKNKFFSGLPFKVTTTTGSSVIKNRLKREMSFERDQLGQDRSGILEKKSDDFVTGRTLKDVHGNPVRVEQVFKRPGDASYQIINITKRDDGLTYLDWKMTYNQKLPSDLGDWGEFFDSVDESFHLALKDVTMGTIKDGKGDKLRWLGVYDPATDDFDETFFVNGVERDGSFDDYQDSQVSDPDQFYSYGELPLYDPGFYGDPAHEVDVIIIRTYLINNDGKIISVKDFATSGDMFSFITTTAGEIILSSDSFLYGDIDMVVIGDIGIVLVMYIF